MNVEANKVVSFHYSVSDGSAEPVDSSRERGEPLTVLIGHGNIIPGLEKALLGRAVGDRFEISVAPAEAYGERRANFTQRPGSEPGQGRSTSRVASTSAAAAASVAATARQAEVDGGFREVVPAT